MNLATKQLFDHSPATRAVMSILERVERHGWKGLTMPAVQSFLDGRHAPSTVRSAFRVLALVGIIRWTGASVKMKSGRYAKLWRVNFCDR